MRWIAVIYIAIIAQTAVSGQDNSIFNIIFKQDFSNSTKGLYNISEWKRDWNNPAYENGLDKTYIIDGGGGNKAMQWNYPKGSVGPTAGGGQFEPPNSAQADEIYMTYNIKFKPGFDWVLGGKLPGLTGGPHSYYSGVQKPAWSDGFSNGLMWGHGYGGQDDKGGIYFYIYHQDMSGLYGDCIRWGNFKFQTSPERWYNITIRMVMNTIKSDGSGGNYDGIMEGFVDGKLVVSKSGMRFRNTSSVHIDKMKIYSHFGGSGAEYGAARDEWTLIDDVELFTYAKGVNVPRGNTASSPGRVLQLPNMKSSSPTPTTDTQAPGVPSGLKMTSTTQNTVSLSWNASTDNTAVTGYHVYLNGNDAGTTSGTSYKIAGLTAGTTYKIAVSAYDAASNTSARSPELSATTTDAVASADAQAPSVPGGLAITGKSQNSISFSWAMSTDNVGVSGYIVFLDGTVKGTTQGTGYTIDNLTANTDYSVTVLAYDAASNKSSQSAILRIRTEDVTSPGNTVTEIVDPTPVVNIIEIHNDAENSAKTISEISSYGNTELHNFGILVSRNQDPSIGGSVFSAQAGTYFVKNEDRVVKNLQVLYNFSEGNGTLIQDRSGSATPVDLKISNPSAVSWLPGQGLKVTGSTMISSGTEIPGLLQELSSTGEVTLETWIKPSEIEQSGPARIVTLSADDENRAVTLGQTGDATGYDYNIRLNTTSVSANGLPECTTTDKYQEVELQHVIYTRDKDGNEKIYINGTERYTGSRTGDFTSWGTKYQLALANELTGNRQWKGTFFLVALYNRALNRDEVLRNYKAGFGKVQFNSVLDNLEPETHYYMAAFAESDLGMHYGEVVDFVTDKPRLAQEDSIQMNVYPNPSDGIFRVSFQYNKIEHATVMITDMNGKLIHSAIIEVNDFGMYQEKQFNLANKMKNGVYFVTLVLGQTTTTKKLIIQH